MNNYCGVSICLVYSLQMFLTLWKECRATGLIGARFLIQKTVQQCNAGRTTKYRQRRKMRLRPGRQCGLEELNPDLTVPVW